MIKTITLLKNIHLSRREPVSLIHFVTNRCNARCPFCFIDFDDPEVFKNELTLAEIDKISKSVGGSLQNVNLTGGEPFSRKDFLDVARCWLRNTNIRSIFVTSNGSLPDRVRTFAETLSSEFPDRKIIFSLSIDGFPQEHDKIRKIDGLFDKVMESYHILRKMPDNVMVNISITVSLENHLVVNNLYDALKQTYGVDAITATIVRDEGVYETPQLLKRGILDAYASLTKRISDDLKSGGIKGYNNRTLQGRLINKKNVIVNKILTETYVNEEYVSPCRAGSIFGIIAADGQVLPCEILDKSFGNLKEYDYNFMALWQNNKAVEIKDWIVDSKCHCTYECAWSFNVLSNLRYQPAMLSAALGKYW